MSTFNFQYYINNSNSLNEFTLKQLRQVIRDDPYVQIARTLYLKNLLILKKPSFEDELKANVAFITNRQLLFELLFDKSRLNNPEEEESVKNINDSEENLISITQPSDVLSDSKDSIDVSSETGTDDSVNPDNLSPSVRRIFTESMQDNIADLINTQVEHPDEASNLERDIRLNSIQLNIEKEYGSLLDKTIADNNDLSFNFDDSAENPSLEKSEDEKRIENLVSDARRAFNTSYKPKGIDSNHGEESTEKSLERSQDSFELLPDEMKEEHQQEISTGDGMSFTEWLDKIDTEFSSADNQYSEGEEKTALKVKAPGGEVKNDLIDNFIRLNPAITPFDPKQAEPKDISNHSIEENEEYLTDTLAKIYIKQERFEKAISVYQKLILKYPEKNTYFANQISEIKKKLDN